MSYRGIALKCLTIGYTPHLLIEWILIVIHIMDLFVSVLFVCNCAFHLGYNELGWVGIQAIFFISNIKNNWDRE